MTGTKNNRTLAAVHRDIGSTLERVQERERRLEVARLDASVQGLDPETFKRRTRGQRERIATLWARLEELQDERNEM